MEVNNFNKIDNSKISLIYGSNISNGNISEGDLECFGIIGDESLHSLCLRDKGIERYPNVKIFENLSYRHSPETVAFFFVEQNDIVFLNTTKNMEKHGKTGILLIPDEISDKQKDSLYKMSEYLKEYRINLTTEMKFSDGIIDGKELYLSESGLLKNALDKMYKERANCK